MMTKYTKGMTHGGLFHADEVFGTALLKIVFGDFKVERVFKVPEYVSEDTLVYDIGGGTYDHHDQLEKREDGVPYAAFGKLWRDFGRMICYSDEVFARIDKELVEPIDAVDNGVPGVESEYNRIIKTFNLSWDEETKDVDDAFNYAVDVAWVILRRKVDTCNSAAKAETLVTQAISESEDGILVLDEFMPWQSYAASSDILVAVYPAIRGGYNLQICPVAADSRELKIHFPTVWDEVKPEGMTFKHASGFMAAFDSKEHAINAAREAVKA